ncbi:MAG: leucine-rich repeat domain-containing protein, partial [Clostridiales bacterium]|nr:leucine-rich repeat domain-containing protein [Clostridiales bacterium]
MKTLKKTWIFLLLVCLAALFSTTALAADNVTSGTCGENLTWTLEDGVMTISGSGAMSNCESDYVPWYSLRSSIETVIIEDGVTSIGNYAFYYCTEITDVTIGNTITSIGRSAFYNCKSLRAVTIPDSVISIGYEAFTFCSLKVVVIPNGVTSIGSFAFSYNKSLKSAIIPDSVTSIGSYAFNNC